MFLNPDDLIQLTGYAMPAYQCQWLRDNSYAFEINSRGFPIVLRAYVEKRFGAGSEAPREKTKVNLEDLV